MSRADNIEDILKKAGKALSIGDLLIELEKVEGHKPDRGALQRTLRTDARFFKDSWNDWALSTKSKVTPTTVPPTPPVAPTPVSPTPYVPFVPPSTPVTSTPATVLKPGNFDVQLQYEKTMKLGDEIMMFWSSGSSGHYSGRAKLVKINAKSIRGELLGEIRDVNGTVQYPLGKEIIAPRVLSSDWSQITRFEPSNATTIPSPTSYDRQSTYESVMKVGEPVVAYWTHAGKDFISKGTIITLSDKSIFVEMDKEIKGGGGSPYHDLPRIELPRIINPKWSVHNRFEPYIEGTVVPSVPVPFAPPVIQEPEYAVGDKVEFDFGIGTLSKGTIINVSASKDGAKYIIQDTAGKAWPEIAEKSIHTPVPTVMVTPPIDVFANRPSVIYIAESIFNDAPTSVLEEIQRSVDNALGDWANLAVEQRVKLRDTINRRKSMTVSTKAENFVPKSAPEPECEEILQDVVDWYDDEESRGHTDIPIYEAKKYLKRTERKGAPTGPDPDLTPEQEAKKGLKELDIATDQWMSFYKKAGFDPKVCAKIQKHYFEPVRKAVEDYFTEKKPKDGRGDLVSSDDITDIRIYIVNDAMMSIKGGWVSEDVIGQRIPTLKGVGSGDGLAIVELKDIREWTIVFNPAISQAGTIKIRRGWDSSDYVVGRVSDIKKLKQQERAEQEKAEAKQKAEVEVLKDISMGDAVPSPGAFREKMKEVSAPDEPEDIGRSIHIQEFNPKIHNIIGLRTAMRTKIESPMVQVGTEWRGISEDTISNIFKINPNTSIRVHNIETKSNQKMRLRNIRFYVEDVQSYSALTPGSFIQPVASEGNVAIIRKDGEKDEGSPFVGPIEPADVRINQEPVKVAQIPAVVEGVTEMSPEKSISQIAVRDTPVEEDPLIQFEAPSTAPEIVLPVPIVTEGPGGQIEKTYTTGPSPVTEVVDEVELRRRLTRQKKSQETEKKESPPASIIPEKGADAYASDEKYAWVEPEYVREISEEGRVEWLEDALSDWKRRLKEGKVTREEFMDATNYLYDQLEDVDPNNELVKGRYDEIVREHRRRNLAMFGFVSLGIGGALLYLWNSNSRRPKA